MSVLDTLFQGEYSGVLDVIKAEAAIDSEQLAGLAASLMPKITEAMSSALSDPASLAQLFGLASQVDVASMAEKPSMVMSDETRAIGETVLKQLLGGTENVSNMISSLSSEFSIGTETLSKALPALTASLLGLVSNPGASSGLSSMISSMLSSEGGLESLLAGLGADGEDDEDGADPMGPNIMSMAKGLLSPR